MTESIRAKGYIINVLISVSLGSEQASFMLYAAHGHSEKVSI